MPCNGGYYYGFWEADPRRWERCRRDAAMQMLSEGWDAHARKFDAVRDKRAKKLWAK